MSRLVNRNVTASRGRTSMRLEPELWNALEEICQREGVSIAEVIRRIEQRGHPGGRTSAVRVHVLSYFRDAATETGHRMAAHGALRPTLPTVACAEPKTVPEPHPWPALQSAAEPVAAS